LGDLECRHLDDRSCEVVNPRDRHVATVSHGAEQIAFTTGEKSGLPRVFSGVPDRLAPLNSLAF
jgi:hypothetical protein